MGVPSGMTLSPYQLECWAALGRLLTPFLVPEVAEAAAAPVEPPVPAVVSVPVETPAPVKALATIPPDTASTPIMAAVPVAESPLVVLAVSPVAASETTVETVPVQTDKLLTADTLTSPGAEIDLETWFPGVNATARTTGAKVAAPLASALEPIDRLPVGAGEFFSGLSWGNVSEMERSAATPAARAGSLLEAVSASDFFAQSVVWGGSAHGADRKLPAPDPLVGRMLAAATASALHLSRKIAGQHPVDPLSVGDARGFFTGLDWHLPDASKSLESSQLAHRQTRHMPI